MSADGKKSDFLAGLEAILFYYGDPISIKKIGEILGVKEEEAGVAVRELVAKLEVDSESGLQVIVKDGGVQLVTKPEVAAIAQKIARDELKEELTPAALETLAIISYLGPLGRAQIDYIRGVNSTFILRNLILRGLVERKEARGKGAFYEYTASFDFLRHVGLKRTEDLPDYPRFREIFEKLRLNEEKVISEK